VCQDAPAKEIHLAQTETVLEGESVEEAVRTILCREIVPGPKKDRWHPLYTSSAAAAREVLTDFRRRQHHEQAYRVGVYDENLDTAPCGYDKQSPDRKRPRFQRGGPQLIGWLGRWCTTRWRIWRSNCWEITGAAISGRCGGRSSTVRGHCT
jgi:hypothetical protein